MSDLVIGCTGLYKSYTQGELDVDVLKGIDLHINKAECLAIVGASGSGKSTLLHLLGGLDSPDTGDVRICGEDINALSETGKGHLRNRSLGFVYQFHHLLGEFTAVENVAMPLLMRNIPVRTAEQKSVEILTRVGLGERIQHKPGEMSGGERQRAAIARAIVTEPDCILADEPTGNLDEKTAQQVFNVLLELNQAMKISLVMATHNTLLANQFNRIMTLHNGKLSS